MRSQAFYESRDLWSVERAFVALLSGMREDRARLVEL